MNAHPAVIVVTHNSQAVINECVDALERQSVSPHQVVIVDSGSADASYLEPFGQKPNFEVRRYENIGFCAANNDGFGVVDPGVEFVLFINPDTFLVENSIEAALRIMANEPQTAVLTGMLKGYDVAGRRPSGLLDSTGVFRTWYGRWYDRGQGQPDGSGFLSEEEVPAICGAFMMCRKQALMSVIENSTELFDSSFFMYKEDIDLSIRLRKNGWKLRYSPQVFAYHARGWARDRRRIDPGIRRLAAASDVRLNLKHRSPYLVWSVCKYLAVRYLRV